ncbi:hypothetical protein [Streptomyces sp. CAU 1734]|uniref:hypothetical protein n=1 Tax=Streptomyces sp. CAU 1734 TaxID=3140360 RepID=UPI0032605279
MPFLLGTFTTISPRLALRWMRGQALRVADGLDPGPGSATRARKAPAAGNRPDGPTRLRDWSRGAEDVALRLQLKDGVPVTFTVDDGPNGRFTLAVWPVAMRAEPDPIPAGCPATAGAAL